jgi:hypothetical protein
VIGRAVLQARRSKEKLQLRANLLLPDEFGKTLRPQGTLER